MSQSAQTFNNCFGSVRTERKLPGSQRSQKSATPPPPQQHGGMEAHSSVLQTGSGMAKSIVKSQSRSVSPRPRGNSAAVVSSGARALSALRSLSTNKMGADPKAAGCERSTQVSIEIQPTTNNKKHSASPSSPALVRGHQKNSNKSLTPRPVSPAQAKSSIPTHVVSSAAKEKPSKSHSQSQPAAEKKKQGSPVVSNNEDQHAKEEDPAGTSAGDEASGVSPLPTVNITPNKKLSATPIQQGSAEKKKSTSPVGWVIEKVRRSFSGSPLSSMAKPEAASKQQHSPNTGNVSADCINRPATPSRPTTQPDHADQPTTAATQPSTPGPLPKSGIVHTDDEPECPTPVPSDADQPNATTAANTAATNKKKSVSIASKAPSTATSTSATNNKKKSTARSMSKSKSVQRGKRDRDDATADA